MTEEIKEEQNDKHEKLERMLGNIRMRNNRNKENVTAKKKLFKKKSLLKWTKDEVIKNKIKYKGEKRKRFQRSFNELRVRSLFFRDVRIQIVIRLKGFKSKLELYVSFLF